MNVRVSTVLPLVPALLAFSNGGLAADEHVNQTFTVPVSVTIDATGLDLASPPGAERLYRQIVAAAENACTPPIGSKGVARRNFETSHVGPCVEQAVRAALNRVAAVTGRDLEQVADFGRSRARVAESR
jgi:UrcA family protein